MKTPRATYSNFGTTANSALERRGLSQSKLAQALDLSTPYINQTFTGKRLPSAQWVDLVADTLDMTDEERRLLHISAARDHGFKF